jgi:hypothetical protein
MKYNRQTIADAEGRFRFERIPPGEYYIVCQITWEVPNPNYRNEFSPLFGENLLKTTGGTACAKVRVGSGEAVNAIVKSW